MVLGILAATVGHDLVSQALSNGLADHYTLSSPSAADFGPWASSSDPEAAVIYTAFYVYNINNPYEFSQGAPLNVTELGPLTYYFRWDKQNISWDPDSDGDRLSYHRYQYYVAADDATRELEQQVVTTLNVPLMGALHAAAAAGSLGGTVINGIINDLGMGGPLGLFTNRTIYETIWGWEDPLLGALSSTIGNPSRYPGLQENMTSAAEAIAKHGKTTMYTGKYTKYLAREYIEWDGLATMQCCPYGPCGDVGSCGTGSGTCAVVSPWQTDEAEDIRGGFGDQFHQNVQSTDQLYVSSHDFGIFRHWRLVNTGEYSIDDIDLLRFQWAPGTMGNASVSTAEAVAYTNNGPSGLLNQSLCEWGAPIYVSQPRFYGASSQLRDNIIGLGPATEEAHGTWLGVEPFTGSTQDFHWRVGINALVQPTPLSTLSGTVTFFPNITANGVYTPIAWADRFGTISDAQAATFKSQVYVARDVMLAARWGGIAAAAVGLLAAVTLFWVATKRRRAIEASRNAQLAWYYEDHYAALMSANGSGGIPLAPGVSMSPVGMNTMGGGLYSPPPVSLAGGLGAAGGAGMQSSLNAGYSGPGGVRAIAYGAGGSGTGGGVEGFAGGGLFSPDHASSVSSGTPGGATYGGASSYGGAGQAFPVMPGPIPAQAGDMVSAGMSPAAGRGGPNPRSGSFQVEDARARAAYSATAGHF